MSSAYSFIIFLLYALIPLVGSVILFPVVRNIQADITLLPSILNDHGFFAVTNLEPIAISIPFSISSTKHSIYLALCCPSPSNWIAIS